MEDKEILHSSVKKRNELAWAQVLRTLGEDQKTKSKTPKGEEGSRNKSKSIENILNEITVENFTHPREEKVIQAQVIEPWLDMIREKPVYGVPWSRH